VRILPATKSGSRLNGDSLFTLQIHAVHLGADSVLAAYVVNRIDATRVKQNAFRQGRFAAKRRRDMNESNNMREMMMTTMMNQPPNDWLFFSSLSWTTDASFLTTYLSMWALIPMLRSCAPLSLLLLNHLLPAAVHEAGRTKPQEGRRAARRNSEAMVVEGK